MQVVLASIFSDSVSRRHLDYYFPQVLALRDALEARGDNLHCCWCEGNSQDSTFDELKRRADSARLDYSLTQHHHEGVYPSVEDPRRFAAASRVGNAALDLAKIELRGQEGVLLWVESDLKWTAETMLVLIEHVRNGLDIVAPMTFFHDSRFYDIYAYRKDGIRFHPWQPYHPAFNGQMMELDSAGSCLAVSADIVQKLSFSPVNCIVGLCDQARGHGHGVWLDPNISVLHPKREYD